MNIENFGEALKNLCQMNKAVFMVTCKSKRQYILTVVISLKIQSLEMKQQDLCVCLVDLYVDMFHFIVYTAMIFLNSGKFTSCNCMLSFLFACFTFIVVMGLG